MDSSCYQLLCTVSSCVCQSLRSFSTGNTAEIYNPSTGVWRATGGMQSFHPFMLTLLLDGRALAVDDSGSTGAPGELYNPSTGQWTWTAGMYYAHSGDATVLLSNGDLLAYGNHFACYAGQFFNPSTNTWSRTIGQCQTGISVGPLTLLGHPNPVALVRKEIITPATPHSA